MNTPDAEVELTENLARCLLKEQAPEYAGEAIRLIGEGWDNAMYRVGDDLIMRLPRREVGAELMRKEQGWLPRIAPGLPVDVPVPIFRGEPCGIYPWPWSLVPWVEGDTANRRGIHEFEAERFAEFLRTLHQPAPESFPRNPFRGVPLEQKRAQTEAALNRVGRQTDLIDADIWEIWRLGLVADCSDAPCVLHGDLHARNVIAAEDGTIASVIDWGDLCQGDRATDLMSIWSLFESGVVRERIIVSLDLSESVWQRARSWAVSFAAMLLDSGLADHPEHASMGENLLRRLVADARSNI